MLLTDSTELGAHAAATVKRPAGAAALSSSEPVHPGPAASLRITAFPRHQGNDFMPHATSRNVY